MIEFRTLGAVDLKGSDGRVVQSVLAQPKRLALLAYLAAAGPTGYRRRDRVIGLFWPELDDAHARGALRQALHFLRSAMGERVIVGRGEEEIGLDPAAIWCDVRAFDRACDVEALDEALELYRGDLLDGFFVSDVDPEFERWLEDERTRLRTRAAQAAVRLSKEYETTRHFTMATHLAERASALSPTDERAVRRVISLLARVGDRAGAIRAYNAFARRLKEDLDVDPSPETQALVEAIRGGAPPEAFNSSPTTQAVAAPRARPGAAPPPQPPRAAAPPASAAPSSAAPSELGGRYRIERKLGRSGTADIYIAHDAKHERPVTLKVLYTELAAALGPERFLREIRLLARMHHPHILPLYDSGQSGSALYYVMPYLEGESLRERMERERQLPVEEALRITEDVASALGYLHAHDVVHRDVKPENVLLAGGAPRGGAGAPADGASGPALLADFGIARAIDRASSDALTASGVALGTPAYMSPEQAAGEVALDGRSDIYSLACMLYEMLAGTPPYRGASRQVVISRHIHDAIPRLRSVDPTLPAAVDEAVARAMAKRAADRFDTAAAFVEALRGTPSAQPAAGPPAKERRWWWR